jgi:hypothetical protein
MVSLSQWALDLTGKPPAEPSPPPVVEDKPPVVVHHDAQELLRLQHEMETQAVEELAYVRRLLASGERAVLPALAADEAEITLRGELP